MLPPPTDEVEGEFEAEEEGTTAARADEDKVGARFDARFEVDAKLELWAKLGVTCVLVVDVAMLLLLLLLCMTEVVDEILFPSGD